MDECSYCDLVLVLGRESTQDPVSSVMNGMFCSMNSSYRGRRFISHIFWKMTFWYSLSEPWVQPFKSVPLLPTLESPTLHPNLDSLLASQCLYIPTQENSSKPYKGPGELVMLLQLHPKKYGTITSKPRCVETHDKGWDCYKSLQTPPTSRH